MSSYQRIRYRTADGRARTLILRDPTEISFLGAPALTGIEIDRYGNEIVRGADERRHIIELELVTKRTPLKWNHHYAELVDNTEAILYDRAKAVQKT